jgi:DNA polymerase-1
MTDPVGEQMSAGTLLLVDGSSYLYRAYHALPDLRSPAGLPTGAIYGVLSMLRRMPSDFKASHCACVFDAKGKTFRDDWYPAYKANRPPMPDDLAQQIEPLHECVRALGWRLICEPGVEADDVIGTLATQAAAAGFEVLISTGDKDLAQLVTPQVTLINTMTNERLDVAGVQQKFGVPPGRIVDYLTLIGDAVDNVPGVDKVGPKTAVKWLETYGSLDAIVAAADTIGGKVGENLRAAREFLPLGRRLVTVVCDLPLPVQPVELGIGEPDAASLRSRYEALGFRSWLKALDEPQPGTGASNSAKATPGEPGAAADAAAPAAVLDASGRHREAYATVLDEASFADWLQRIEAADAVAFDSETTSLDPLRAELVGLSFAIGDGEACYIPLAHRYAGVPEQLDRGTVLARLRPWLENAGAKKIGQNLKYDQHVLANHGIALRGVADDTLLESYVLDAGKDGVRGHDLGELARRHLGLETIAYAELCGKGASEIGFEQVDIERAAAYAAEDADLTWRIHGLLRRRLDDEPAIDRVYREIELPVREVLFRMERNGVLVDADRLARQSHEIGQRLLALEGQAHALAGQPFNLASPKQLGEILFTRLGLPVKKKTPSGGPSTDEEVLTELALDYPLPKLLLEHRSLAKLKGTYTDKLPAMVNPDTGRVHTSFSQSTAVTGRLASSDPNLQNIPVRTAEGRKIRAAFVAPPGARIVSADYSQIELRIMAHLSGDARLCEAFAAGEDIHRATAAGIFGTTLDAVGPDQRRVAKVINFGLIYGMSAFGLARELGLERGAAQAYIEQYFARYPGVAKYMESTRASAHDRGYVETVFGRRLWLPEIRARQQARRQGAERAAINAPMQGTAADLIKLAMIAVQDWLDAERLATRLVLQVHDELVLEVPDAELATLREALPRLMTGVAELRVPLLVDVGSGQSWDEAH